MTIQGGALGDVERSLLLAVARTETSAPQRDRVRSLVEAGPVWSTLLDAAEHHGLGPLLYHHLRELETLVHQGTMEALLARHRSVARRNLYLTTELQKLVTALRQEGVRTLAFKGPVTACHYGSLALRPFGDVDIVVPRADRERAIRLLEARAFRPWHEGVDDAEYALPFDREQGRLCVDLHWGFARSWFGAALDFDRLWERKETVRPAGVDLDAFSVEDQMLHLCIHGAKHGPTPWPRLKWIVDVAELLRANPHRDWDGLVERAQAVGCRRMVSLGAALARDVLGRPLPGGLERASALDAQVTSQIPWVLEGLWSDADQRSVELGDRLRFDLATRERARDRWAYVWRRILTPGKRDREALGAVDAGTSAWHRPFRLLRLAWRYGLHPRRLGKLLNR